MISLLVIVVVIGIIAWVAGKVVEQLPDGRVMRTVIWALALFAMLFEVYVRGGMNP